MIRALVRHWYGIAVGALLVGIVVVAAFLVVTAFPDLVRVADAPTPAPSTTPAPTPLSGMAVSPIGIQMPADSDCAACHVTASGVVGTRPIPVLAHPLWGWRNCTACHADDSLVQSAPGHTGLHKDECLICHQVRDASETAAPRPHHIYTDKPCVACHGVEAEAPLPTDMAGRGNCWICHGGTEFADLFGEAPTGPASPTTVPPSPSATPGTG